MRDLVKKVRKENKSTQKNVQLYEEGDDVSDDNKEEDDEQSKDFVDFLDSVNDSINFEQTDQDVDDTTIQTNDIFEIQNLLFSRNESSKNNEDDLFIGNVLNMQFFANKSKKK
ncbi:unnamed protein product [Chironomus riparius]|uniref:Uncharacterized protein n=1 Tax=Chironomus riparius TaxID=315576 RepID=A0A9N9WWW1_9DIPT|nr:unnamed protein product [Chironomus riparius]